MRPLVSRATTGERPNTGEGPLLLLILETTAFTVDRIWNIRKVKSSWIFSSLLPGRRVKDQVLFHLQSLISAVPSGSLCCDCCFTARILGVQQVLLTSSLVGWNAVFPEKSQLYKDVSGVRLGKGKPHRLQLLSSCQQRFCTMCSSPSLWNMAVWGVAKVFSVCLGFLSVLLTSVFLSAMDILMWNQTVMRTNPHLTTH